MRRVKAALIIAGLWLPMVSVAQDDLLSELDQMEKKEEKIDFASATFKTTRLINGHSIETNGEGVLLFLISHRFGRLTGGPYEYFGLDNANIRFGFEYGVTDRFDIGIGRSSFEKTYDGYLKYKLLRQSKGKRKMPLSVTLFTSIAIKTLKWPDETRENYFSSRLFYTYQVLIARKFSDRFSLQLTPTIVHRNLVAAKNDRNTVFALMAGGRAKITGSLALNLEYCWVPRGQINSLYNGEQVQDALSIGLDIETGGHVFQVYFSNSRGIIEKAFLTETNGLWWKGDVHFGFSISRVFTVYDRNKAAKKRQEKKLKRQVMKG